MRVLVTGGAGFVGSHIVDALVAAGHRPCVVDDLSTGNLGNIERISNPDIGDGDVLIRKVSALGDLTGFDAIIHAAAYADLRQNWSAPGERDRLYRNNVDETRALLEAVPQGMPFLFLSTASVYGARPKNDNGPTNEFEANPETCESPYAASKMACEAMIAAYAKGRDFPYKIGRLVNVVGARSKHGVIGDFVRMNKRHGSIHAADNGKQKKSWVHVKDVADAFVRMLQPDVPSGIYTVTSEERISWWQVVDAMGVDRKNVTFEDRAGGAVGDPVDLWCSGEKLAPFFKPRMPIADGIKDAIDWLVVR